MLVPPNTAKNRKQRDKHRACCVLWLYQPDQHHDPRQRHRNRAPCIFDCTSLVDVTIGNSVSLIWNDAFSGCSSLTNIAIPDSVTGIGPAAFYFCRSLTRATLGNGLTSITSSLFYGCTNLTGVTIGNSVTTIGDWSFYGCFRLPGLDIPNSITNIGYQAFRYFSGLTNVTTPSSVRNIGEQAFEFCSSLVEVNIGKGVTSIGLAAFSSFPKLTAITVDPLNPSYSSVDGVLLNKSQTTLITTPESKTGSYMIPESVTSLADGAFSWCTSLTTVTIPRSVTSIGFYAFAYCGSLTGIYFLGTPPNASIASARQATAYYLPGPDWGPTFADLPTAPWVLPYPVIGEPTSSGGLEASPFAFIISWATNTSVVVEASTDLAKPTWTPLRTNTLANGWSYFSDPQWASYPSRFYRIRSR